MKRIRVAVVGSGAAGLVALRHLASRPQIYEIIAFEQTGCVGGTWVYSDNTGSDEYGLPIHSSMYKSLITNLPKEVMAFPDFPFDKSLPSFVGHKDVLKYLEDYTSHYSLMKYIQFFTQVEQVKPRVLPGGSTLWDVTTKLVKEPGIPSRCQEFDAIMICNGHFAEPHFPDLPNLGLFSGDVVHSHCYRHPEKFSGKRVVVLGAGPSGIDITLEVSKVASKVYLSHNTYPLESSLPENVVQSAGISSVKSNSVVLYDNKELEVDSIVLCTGYEYKFPFLSPECAVSVIDRRVMPLYKHMINTSFPSMCFIGICNRICPFPLFDHQVQLFLHTLDGTVNLPTKEEMDSEINDDFTERLRGGMPQRYAHVMGFRQWPYNDELADMGHFSRLPPVLQTLYETVHMRRCSDVMIYKKDNYEIVDDMSFKTVDP